MADTPLSSKFGLKPGMRLLVLNPPSGFLAQLSPLPDGVTVSTADSSENAAYDCVITFVQNKAEVDQHAPPTIRAAKDGGQVWFAYPKKTSKIKTDMHRDAGWEALDQMDWAGIRQISIDEVWSALRFRPERDIKRSPNSTLAKAPREA